MIQTHLEFVFFVHPNDRFLLRGAQQLLCDLLVVCRTNPALGRRWVSRKFPEKS